MAQHLKSSEEMYLYCVKNELGLKPSQRWAIKNYDLLINSLNQGEEVYTVFTGSFNKRIKDSKVKGKKMLVACVLMV